MKHYLLWKDIEELDITYGRKWRWIEVTEEREKENEREKEEEDDSETTVLVKPVIGDLGKYRFDLSNRRWQKLAERIDVIYNAATHVNGVFPYAALKASNVTSVMEIIRLATDRKLKRVNHISTLSILSGSPYTREEDMFLSPHEGFPFIGGYRYLLYYSNKQSSHINFIQYSQSKLIAECLIHSASRKGLPVTIFRPGTISGDSRSGASNLKDFVNKYIMGTIQLGFYPNESGDSQTDDGVVFDMAAVDWVASAIIRISQSSDSVGKAYHLFNGIAPSAPTLMTIAQSANSFGDRLWPELKPTPFMEWKKLLYQACDQTGRPNALAPIRSYFDGSRFPRSRIFDCSQTLQLVDPPPAITEDILKRYILYYLHQHQLP